MHVSYYKSQYHTVLDLWQIIHYMHVIASIQDSPQIILPLVFTPLYSLIESRLVCLSKSMAKVIDLCGWITEGLHLGLLVTLGEASCYG